MIKQKKIEDPSVAVYRALKAEQRLVAARLKAEKNAKKEAKKLEKSGAPVPVESNIVNFQPKPETPEIVVSVSDTIKTGVTGVTGVTVNNDAASSGNTIEKPGVTGVTNDDEYVPCEHDDLEHPHEEPTQESATVVDAVNSENMPEQSFDEIIKHLASLRPIEYDKERLLQAKALGVRPGTLDAEVKAFTGVEKEEGRLPFDNIEPHSEPISPSQLLNEVSDTIRQFIVLDEHQAHAAALWCSLTWFIDVVEVAPLAIINAPEKSCGKTQLLNIIGRMSYRPLPASNASSSALFRAVELWKPTILIDEADTFFQDNTELHGMVNAGYLKGGYVLRSEAVGDSFEPKMFSVYSAKALAGIKLEKHLPDATMSRGIIFNLRRKLSGESVSRLRHADPDLFTGISSKLARFADDYSYKVKRARPTLPDELSDREQDNWDGMLAIASCAGDEWLNKAIKAALKLSESAGEKTVSAGNELLSDIQNIFDSKRIDKIKTQDLINALCEDDEAPWSTYNRGKPIVPRQLVKQLEPYGVKPKQIRINTYDQFRGFELVQFSDSFMRYLATPILSVASVTNPANPETAGPEAVSDSVTCDTYICHNDNLSVTDNVTCDTYAIYSSRLQASNGAVCDTVTDKKAFLGDGSNEKPKSSDMGYF